MIRSTLNRAVLAATFCVLAFSQAAHAAAPMTVAKRQANELAALQARDVNDERTPAGMAYEEAKRAGEDCPLADKSSRYEVASVAKAPSASGASKGGSVGGRATAQ